MPIGKALDAHDRFKLALGHYYKAERDRSEECLGDIITILDSPDEEHKQVVQILERLITHYGAR